MHCSEEVDELQMRHPNAFLLLCQIARRAKWKDCGISNLKAGQCHIGDWREAGIPSEKSYRTAKIVLEKAGLAQFRGATRGTIATLTSSRIFSVSEEAEGGQRADKGQAEGGQVVTKRAGKGRTEGRTAGQAQLPSDQEFQENLPTDGADSGAGGGRTKGGREGTERATNHNTQVHTDTCTPLPPPGESGEGDGEERCLPKGYARMPERLRRNTKVLRNSPTMIRINGWFRRRPETLWTVSEAVLLKAISPRPEEVEGMERYYLAPIAQNRDYRRRDLITLLNNWQGELDRARNFSTNGSD